MSAQTPEQEPSIEEILASIRQIISDDDEGAPASSAAPPPPAPPKPEPVASAPPPPPPPVEDDILELKDPIPPERPIIEMEDSIEEEKIEDIQDVDPFDVPAEPIAPEEPEEDIAKSSPPPDVFPEDSILNPAARIAALSGFVKLADNIAINKRRQASEGPTLEDIVRDLLQPMLRVWLDDNLPSMIERLVEKELEKLARNAMDD
jgi:cell pole-organizing protein PopZ